MNDYKERQSQKLLDKYPRSSHKSNEMCNLIVTREQSQTLLNYPRWKRWNSDWRIRRRWWCFHWSQNLTSTSIPLEPYRHVLLVPKQVKRKNTNFLASITYSYDRLDTYTIQSTPQTPLNISSSYICNDTLWQDS